MTVVLIMQTFFSWLEAPQFIFSGFDSFSQNFVPGYRWTVTMANFKLSHRSTEDSHHETTVPVLY